MFGASNLRDFVQERLLKAAGNISGEFEKVIAEHQQEIARQRMLLDIGQKSGVEQVKIEVPQQLLCKEEEEEIPVVEKQPVKEGTSSSLR